MSEIKTRLKAAFAEIRATGLMARQNFMCCSGCALSAAASKCCVPGRKERGFVYYHRQDNEALLELGKCYIRFSSFNRAGDMPANEIAALAITAFTRQALKVDWSGNTMEAILVSMPEAA